MPIFAESLFDQDCRRLVDCGLAEVIAECCREACRKAGLGQESLGLLEILVEWGRDGPCSIGRRAGVGAPHLVGAIVERVLEDLVIGHGQSDGLTDLQIVEGLLGDVHVKINQVGLDRRADYLHFSLRLKFGKVLRRQVEGYVGIAALQERSASAGRRNDALTTARSIAGCVPDFHSSNRASTSSEPGDHFSTL